MKLIGITSFISESRIALNQAYISAFTRPSCAALIIPPFPVTSREFLHLDKFKADFRAHVDRIVHGLDGLCCSGGADINPLAFGQTNYASKGCDIVRDFTELALIDGFMRVGKPILGICKGHQVLGLALGLSNFLQDLPGHELHQQLGYDMERDEPCHTIWTRGAFRTYMTEKLGRDAHELSINSMHHQSFCLTKTGKRADKKDEQALGGFANWYRDTVAAYETKHQIKILATTPTVIEAFEKEEAKIVGYQSHPEHNGPTGLMIAYWLDRYLNA